MGSTAWFGVDGTLRTWFEAPPSTHRAPSHQPQLPTAPASLARRGQPQPAPVTDPFLTPNPHPTFPFEAISPHPITTDLREKPFTTFPISPLLQGPPRAFSSPGCTTPAPCQRAAAPAPGSVLWPCSGHPLVCQQTGTFCPQKRDKRGDRPTALILCLERGARSLEKGKGSLGQGKETSRGCCHRGLVQPRGLTLPAVSMLSSSCSSGREDTGAVLGTAGVAAPGTGRSAQPKGLGLTQVSHGAPLDGRRLRVLLGVDCSRGRRR